jgi:nucleotidyltransferase AbiEii toxin of type IV toxin-antitoxin system
MREIKNRGTSIKQRLLNHARAQNTDYQRTLVRYAFERFLFRLSQHDARDRLVLKGAMLFIAWSSSVTRPTGDLDLLGLGSSDPRSMREILDEIFTIEDESDGIRFDPLSIQVDATREERHRGLRIAANARLDTAIVKLQIDVGFGDKVYPPARRIEFPCLLAGMRAPDILAYPPETVIAEKFEATVRYGDGTTRLKDIYDIWTIAQTFSFEMPALVRAIRGTFEQRGTARPGDVPIPFTRDFAVHPDKMRLWEGFLRRTKPAMVPASFEAAVRDVARFLVPVLGSLDVPERAAGRWDPSEGWSSLSPDVSSSTE